MARIDSKQREKILETAIRVFAEKGMKGATIRMVGQKAGVNSALIYYYFEDKKTLFLEAVHLVLIGFLTHLQTKRHAFRNAEDRLEYIVDGLFGYYSLHPERMRLIIHVLTLHADVLGQVIGRLAGEKTLIPLEVLDEGMKRGELRAGHPLHVWWSIIGMCMFSMLLKDVVAHIGSGSLPLPPADLKERRNHIVQLLVHGLVQPAGRSRSIRKE